MNRLIEIEPGSVNRRAEDLPRKRSARLYHYFFIYVSRYVSKRLHAVRIAREGSLPLTPPGPLLIVMNHPSWWDPLIGFVIADLIPDREHYAPIDSHALVKYRFFERLGFFGIEPRSVRGTRAFLRICESIFAEGRPESAIWITAQGTFVDPRARPVTIRPGVSRLATRLVRGTILPLAIELTFWEERSPEALTRFGKPIAIVPGTSSDDYQRLIEAELESALDSLAQDSISRDPARFEILLKGRSGVGGIYDIWRRLKSWITLKRFRPEHGREIGE